MHNRHPERIRLSGIDCPEKAKQFTTSLVYGKEVIIQPLRKDRHECTVGDVLEWNERKSRTGKAVVVWE